MARLKWLVIPIFLILLMSHNAGAVSPVYDLSNFDNVFTYNSTFNCTYNNTSLDANSTNVWTCALHAGNSLNSIITSGNVTVKQGDIVEFPILIYSVSNFSLANALKFEWLNTRYGFSLIDIRLENNNYQSVFGENTSLIPTGYTINQIWVITLRANQDMTTQVGFGSGSYPFMTYSGETVSGFYLVYRMGDVKVWRNMGSQENKEQEEKTQEQTEAGDDASSSSTDDVGEATQSLASAMGSIVSVIKDTPASDCNISISTTGSSSGFTSAIGALNLCSGVPSNILNTIRGLAALVIVPYVLYAAYSICIKMYRTFTEVQNT